MDDPLTSPQVDRAPAPQPRATLAPPEADAEGEAAPPIVPQAPTAQAAAIAWTTDPDRGLVICLVSANSGGWTLPKGHVDPGHTAHEAAAIESYEEAGLIGVVVTEAFGVFEYTKPSGKHCRVEVFELRVERVLHEWDERHARERIWIEPAEAEHWIEHPEQVRLVEAFSDARAGRSPSAAWDKPTP